LFFANKPPKKAVFFYSIAGFGIVPGGGGKGAEDPDVAKVPEADEEDEVETLDG
jgi:hypothetical protein